MKKGVFIFFVLSLIFACTKKDDDTEKASNFLEYYELVKMTNSAIGTVTTGTEMEWQEAYLLFVTDSTFKKSRIADKVTFEATGTYTYKTIENQKYIEFTFNEDSIVISNCFGDLVETLQVFEDGDRLISTWSACDGPGLEYNRMGELCGTEF